MGLAEGHTTGTEFGLFNYACLKCINTGYESSSKTIWLDEDEPNDGDLNW